MKISIIIRCYNEEKHIGKLLRGIEKQEFDDEYEVIVVDSGSTDKTTEIAESYNCKIIRITPEEFSFGYALNVGCEVASGEILLFASAHVYPVYNSWLEEMFKYFNDQDVAIVYGKQIGNEVTKYSEHQLFKKWFPAETDLNQAYPFCNNANCAIRRELWVTQKYDEHLTGLEDLDWAKKILTKGFRIVYNAEATIVHVHEETPSRIYNRYRREAIALKEIMPEQDFDFIDFIRLFFTNTITDYFHSIQEGKFLGNIWDIPMFRYNQFRGTLEGYKRNTLVTKALRNRFYYPNSLKKKDIISNQESKKIEY